MEKLPFLVLLSFAVSCQKYTTEKRVCTVKSIKVKPPVHSLTPEYTYYASTNCGINLAFKRPVHPGDTFTLSFYKKHRKN